VLSFAPLVLVVSAAIAVLEDSGLGPRMATSLHNLFSAFGLSGRSLYPLVLGFGCNVPAAIQSRISIDNTERFEVLASVPFVICQARLMVMMYFIQALLPGRPLLQAALMLSIYVVSIILYLLTAKLVRRVLRVREPPELVTEIPLT
jgi:ferrous iron transport protein B